MASCPDLNALNLINLYIKHYPANRNIKNPEILNAIFYIKNTTNMELMVLVVTKQQFHFVLICSRIFILMNTGSSHIKHHTFGPNKPCRIGEIRNASLKDVLM